jgi:hypothetical protein
MFSSCTYTGSPLHKEQMRKRKSMKMRKRKPLLSVGARKGRDILVLRFLSQLLSAYPMTPLAISRLR